MFRFQRFALHSILPRLCVPACLAVVLFSGCNQEDGIRTYTVDKPAVVARRNTPVAGSAQPMVEPVDRMIGAIVPRGSRTWFFKLVGPNQVVNAEIEKFASFVGSLKIDEGDDAKPSWTLPTGWTEKPGDAMRYATISVATNDRPLDLSVTVLPTAPGEPNDFILSNVNRWRGQMSLQPTDQTNLFSNSSRTEEARQSTINGMTVTFVNIVGKFAGMGAPPFASGARSGAPPFASQPAPPGIRASAPASGLKFQTPEGWTVSKGNPIAASAFEVIEGEKRVEITATSLPSSGLLQNVNRWRGQILLEPIDDKQLAAAVVKVPVGSASADFVELKGTNEQKTPEAILGVVLNQEGRAWFFKLKGNAELAEREKAHFLEFVKSIRFE